MPIGLRKTDKEFRDELTQLNPNIELLSKYTRATDRVKCKCKVCGYEWAPKAYSLLNNHGRCPNCSLKSRIKKRTKTNDRFNEEMQEKHPDIEVLGKYSNGKTPILFRCKICGYEWESSPDNLLNGNHGKGNGCPNCRKRSETSFPEQALYFYVLKAFPNAINGYRDIFDNGMELDVYVPSKNIGIEYDGVAWHGNQRDRELRKYKIVHAHGIKLIRICEDSTRDTVACDVIIYRRKPFDLKSLTEVISKALLKLGTSGMNIDVERDHILIDEQYKKYFIKNSLATRFSDSLQYWDYSANGSITPKMISAGTTDSYYFKCIKCGESYKEEVKNWTNGTQLCPTCRKKQIIINKRISFENFKKRLKEIHPEIIVKGKYTDLDTPIECECGKCHYGSKGEWKPIPLNLLNRRNKGGNGCPRCAGRMKKSHQEFVENVKKINPDIKIISHYTNNKTKVQCICKKCGYGSKPEEQWWVIPETLIRGGGCPKCARREAAKRKSVPIVCIETGQQFESAKEASKVLGIPRTSISNCVNGNKKTAAGLHFKKQKR